jgi:hypothetical protein
MAGDYSRRTFLPEKHYSGVLMQQGRVQLDADWNEQWEILQHRLSRETVDIIGLTGVPKKDGGFYISLASGGTDLNISPGRIYIDGLLFELGKGSPATYFHQPYYPDPDASYFVGSPPESPVDSPPTGSNLTNLANGNYLVYLEAWQREINYLDDPHIHEVALGEADTTTRIQNIWQVKIQNLLGQDGSTINCKTAFDEWKTITAPYTGKLNVQTAPSTDPQNPCVIPEKSGYLGLENQLYRVEVQSGPDAGSGTFKWSRDNATILSSIESIQGPNITLSDLGKDSVLGFGLNQWVEIVDEEAVLEYGPNPLVQIVGVTPSSMMVTVSSDVSQYIGKTNLKLRRWDQSGSGAGSSGLPMAGGWVDLENGIQVNFLGGTYRPGDFWLIPARTATGDIEWPPFSIPDINTVAQPPVGIRHHFCRLALAIVTNGQVQFQDCRNSFPPLTHICASDICYDNSVANLKGAVNVQKALDQLVGQERLTRTHLLGLGIVCGLDIIPVTDANNQLQSIGISKGCGITSEGYLIHLEDTRTFAGVQEYNALQENYYDKFVDTGANPPSQKFKLWEFVAQTGGEGVSPVSSLFLQEMFFLLFIEELEDPSQGFANAGCCDKSVKVGVKLLALSASSKQYLPSLLGESAFNSSGGIFSPLPKLKMPRWDVPNSFPQYATDILKGFYSVFATDQSAPSGFLTQFQTALNSAWVAFSTISPGRYPNNPFSDISGIMTDKAIIQKLGSSPLANLQYLYDYFSDLMIAYDEFRTLGLEIANSCCPDNNLFPRHLMLGSAPSEGQYLSTYRNYFIPSPLLQNKNSVLKLGSLFSRLVLMAGSFSAAQLPKSIGITPSQYGDLPLSGKAIPFYYSPDPLYTVWDFDKSVIGEANQNLSYNAANSYNTQDDFIMNPMKYDLEPYNFFRVEGHIGQSFADVQSAIQSQLVQYRFPFQLVVLHTTSTGAGDDGLFSTFQASNPGIQHNSGVPSGGTFILVYSNDPQAGNNFTYRYPGGLLNLPVGTVIADFFLPYFLPRLNQFDIQPRTFLFDDAHNYPFTTVPQVTSAGKVQMNFQSAAITNPGTLQLMTDQNNVLYLHPAASQLPGTAPKTLQTTLTYQGITLPITIIKPDASFTIQQSAINPNDFGALMITVKATSTDATSYLWSVNQQQNAFQNVANPPGVPLSQLMNPVKVPSGLTISLTVTYTLNGTTSSDTQVRIIQIG